MPIGELEYRLDGVTCGESKRADETSCKPPVDICDEGNVCEELSWGSMPTEAACDEGKASGEVGCVLVMFVGEARRFVCEVAFMPAAVI